MEVKVFNDPQILAITLPPCKATQEYRHICGLYMKAHFTIFSTPPGTLLSALAPLLSKMRYISWVVVPFRSLDISASAIQVMASILSAAENERGEHWVTLLL